jgi:large subunit ribosomal protein L15
LDEITYEDYFKQKLARNVGADVKVLGEGELTRKVKIHAHKFSGAALEKIKKSGGEAIILGGEGN